MVEISDKIKKQLGQSECEILRMKFMTVTEYFEFMFGFKKTTRIISVHDHELDDDFRHERDMAPDGQRLNLDVRVSHGDIVAVWMFGYALLRDLFIQRGSSARRQVLSVYSATKGLAKPEHDLCVALGILAVDVATIIDGKDCQYDVNFPEDGKHGAKIAERCHYSWRELQREVFG